MQIVKSPEILSVYRDIPNLQAFLQSFYKCKYADFFKALGASLRCWRTGLSARACVLTAAISEQVQRDQFFSLHFPYWLREMRIVAYGQACAPVALAQPVATCDVSCTVPAVLSERDARVDGKFVRHFAGLPRPVRCARSCGCRLTSSPPRARSELSRFIAGGRLHCKIDKVNGIVETNRPDAKNAQYQAVLKQGDLLLNRIQKLTKVISY